MALSKKREPKAKVALTPKENDKELRGVLAELIDVMTPLCARAERDRLAALKSRLDSL